MPRRSRPIEERFWERVIITPACWLWAGGKSSGSGYGTITTSRPETRPLSTHRFSYELRHGPIPPGLVINHLCRNRLCVNPDHLEAVTQRENVLYSDRLLGIRSAAVACPQGHPYSAENTLWTGTPRYRACKTCSYARAAQWRAAQKRSAS